MKHRWLALWMVFLGARALPAAQKTPDDWRGQGVLYLKNTPNARLHPVPVEAVRLGDGFWAMRRSVNVERSLPTLLDLLEEHGVVDNFRRLSGRKKTPRRGPLYTDSDLYKWIEAAAWAIASNETSAASKEKLRVKVDSLVDEILAAQEPSGYLNTYYVGERVRLRFTELVRSHEGYCLGHMIQAGIAYYRATGNRRLLNGAIKFSDYLIANFGPAKRPFFTGHPELEMAMVELYRTTGNNAYLEFARYLLSGVDRERLKLKESEVRYTFSGSPFTSRTQLEGHAVRALYAASGAADYFAEAGDPSLRRTLDVLWNDLVNRKMYITGGAGSRAQGEAFGEPYELPNAQAYTESCAAIANVMWNFRMLSITGEAKYADVLERALYNGANSGVSLSGTLYCYRNPLASSGEKVRNPWYETTCCPPNIQRLLASLPGYFYATSRDGIFVNLYHNSDVRWKLEDGTPFTLTQSSGYPWSGEVRLKVQPQKAARFTLYLRWPEWASEAAISVNGVASDAGNQRSGYIPITRTWQPGDIVVLNFPMQITPMVANPRVANDYGKVAIERGPLVYALEQMDQGGAKLADISLRDGVTGIPEFRKDLLGGVWVLKPPGLVAERPFSGMALYQPLAKGFPVKRRPVTLTLIPYYSWANREPTPMEVWVPLGKSNESNSVSPPSH